MGSFEKYGLLSLAALLIAAGDPPTEEKKGPPFADGPTEKKAEPKPETRNWTVVKDNYSYTFTFTPGIPEPGQVVEVFVNASSIPKTPHPKYGTRVPIDGARITLDAINPAGELVGRYLTHTMPLASGKYGLHFTPSQDGLYRLVLKGKTSDGQELSAEVKLPVNVWPLPKELEGSGAEGGASSGRSVVKKPITK